MYLIGYDIGSSSIKAALLDAATGKCLATATGSAEELVIQVPRSGWAEQDPEMWWQEVVKATHALQKSHPFDPAAVNAIGIAYQMHGLVCVDKEQQVLRHILCRIYSIPPGILPHLNYAGCSRMNRRNTNAFSTSCCPAILLPCA
jgi:sugar (pentulose or hexulose) kinase